MKDEKGKVLRITHSVVIRKPGARFQPDHKLAGLGQILLLPGFTAHASSKIIQRTFSAFANDKKVHCPLAVTLDLDKKYNRKKNSKSQCLLETLC